MSFDCTDCKKFLRCVTNSEEWEKAKKLYPKNELLQLSYINRFAQTCKERVL